MKKSEHLTDKISKSIIKMKLRSRTRDGVLKELLSVLSLDEKARQLIFTTLIKRENMGSTGVGKGIAIPHARTLLVKDFMLVIGLSKKGIAFSAIDRKPVHLFFLLIAPPQETSNSYLVTLGKIAELAKNITKDKRIFKVKNEEEFLKIIKEIERS
jgi:mannitol/fructose-specific phosphotransferase system IIA component (Ntr-type)